MRRAEPPQQLFDRTPTDDVGADVDRRGPGVQSRQVWGLVAKRDHVEINAGLQTMTTKQPVNDSGHCVVRNEEAERPLRLFLKPLDERAEVALEQVKIEAPMLKRDLSGPRDKVGLNTRPMRPEKERLATRGVNRADRGWIDAHEAAMPQVEQVSRRELAGPLIARQHGIALPTGIGCRQPHRRDVPQSRLDRAIGPGTEHQEPVHLLIEDRRRKVLGGVGLDRDHVQPMLRQRLRCAADELDIQRRVAAIAVVKLNQGDAAGTDTSTDPDPRRLPRVLPEIPLLLGNRKDTAHHLVRRACVAVHDPGNRRYRNAGRLGDVLKPHKSILKATRDEPQDHFLDDLEKNCRKYCRQLLRWVLLATMSTFRLGIIGCGSIARRHRDAAIARGVPIVAAVDIDKARAEAFTAGCNAATFASVDDLLNDPAVRDQLSAVVIATPPSARRRLVETLANAGISMLIEKPLAHNASEALEIAAIAEAHPDVVAVVGYCHRFTPAIQEIRRRTRAGEIGHLVRFENTFAASMPGIRQTWMSDPAVSGGGSLIDTACHSLDLFNFLVGRPSFEGAVLYHAWPGRGESNATLLVSATVDSEPVAGVITSGWLEVPRYHLRVVGTEGLFEYDYADGTKLILHRPDDSRETIPVERHEVRFARQFDGFLQAVRDQGSLGDLCTFGEAAILNKVFDDAYGRSQAEQWASA